MQSDYLLWLAAAFYAWRVAEELVHDWKTCATKALHLPNSVTAFYIVNVVLVVLGIYCVYTGWQLTSLSLIYLASMLLNVVLFQMIPTIIRRRFSSSLIRLNPEEVRLFGLSLRIDDLVLLRRVGALLLFLPAATAIYSATARDGKLIVPALVVSMMSIIVVIAYPILRLRDLSHHSKEVNHENSGD